MKAVLLAVLATTALASAAAAQGYPMRVPVYPAPRGLSADEVRDYEQDRMERRHEMERRALRMNQKAESRDRGLDDDDD